MARERKPSGKIDRLLDELMEDGVDAEDLFGEDGLLKRMKRRMAERTLEVEDDRSSRLREACAWWQELRQQ
jgi:hypothetical protein